MLIINILSLIDWRHVWSLLCTCEDELLTSLVMYVWNSKQYAYFEAFGFQVYTHSETPNLTSNFVFKLIVNTLYPVNWRHGWSVLYVCRWAIIFLFIHMSRFLALNFTHCPWSSKLYQYLCLNAYSQYPKSHWLSTWLKRVLYVWGQALTCTHFIGFWLILNWLSTLHTSSLKL